MAAVIGGALALGGSVFSGVMGNKSAKKAAGAMERGATASNISQANTRYVAEDMFQTGRMDTGPYRDIGAGAVMRLSDIFGVQPQLNQGLNSGEMAELEQLEAMEKQVKGHEERWANSGNYRKGFRRSGQIVPTMNARESERLTALRAKMANPTAAPGTGAAPGAGGTPGATATPGTPAWMSSGFAVPGALPTNMNGTPQEILESLPGYQFRLSEGQKAIDRGQRGYSLTPRALKEMTRYSQGVASSEWKNYLDRATGERDKALESMFRLAGVGQTGVGQSIAGGNAALGVVAGANNTASNTAVSTARGIADTNMAGGAAVNNAVQGGLDNATTLLMYNDYLKRLPQPTYGGSGPQIRLGADGWPQ